MDKYKLFLTKGIAETKPPKSSKPLTLAVRDADTDTGIAISNVSSPDALPRRPPANAVGRRPLDW